MRYSEISFEAWKPIKGYPNYMVSAAGRVKNIKFNRILKQSTSTNGYFQVGLSNNGKTKSVNVHYLVAQAFLGERPYALVTNHINHDRKDNRVVNLEYISQLLNMRQAHSLRTGKKLSDYEKHCKYCGRLMSREKYQNKFCSRDCFFKNFHVKLKCKTCGKLFWKGGSLHRREIKDYPGKGKNNYCSRYCFGVWLGKTHGWGTR